MTDRPHKPATRLVTAGRRKDWTHGIVNPPVYRASTCLFDTYADLRAGVRNPDDGLFYGRRGTPTQWALREAITDLEGGDGTWLFPSGVAAVNSAILAFCKAGDHILVPDNAYEPTRLFARGLARQMGITAGFYDPLIGAEIASLLTDQTKVVVVESPGSLTFEVQDLPTIADAAHAKGAVVVADSTWATPLLLKSLDLGADVAVHACTKYIVGHSDVMMGSATARGKAWQKIQQIGVRLGQTVSADDAYLALRGLRTLGPRLAQHQSAAVEIARWLSARDDVRQVLHPALPNCPGHDLWQRDFAGSSGLFAILLEARSDDAIAAMVDHMTLFNMGFSWGGFESLILPADPGPIRTATAWPDGLSLFRIHVGLEDSQDLKHDLDAGLARYFAA